MIDAHSYLMSIQECQQRIDLKVQQVQDLRAQIESISAPLDKEQVSHTRNVAVMADTIATIVDMQKEIDQQTNDLMIAKRKALCFLHVKAAVFGCVDILGQYCNVIQHSNGISLLCRKLYWFCFCSRNKAVHDRAEKNYKGQKAT